MNKSNINNITGDKLITKPSKTYAENYDAIFRKEELTPMAESLKSSQPIDKKEESN